jgi:hypothetical protein
MNFDLRCLWVFFGLLLATAIACFIPGIAWRSISNTCEKGETVNQGDCWKGATLLACAAAAFLIAIIVLLIIWIIYSRNKSGKVASVPQSAPSQPATRGSQTMVEVIGPNGKPIKVPLESLSNMYPEGQVFAVVPHGSPPPIQQQDQRLYVVDPYNAGLAGLDAPLNRMQRRITSSKQVLEEGIEPAAVNRGGGPFYFDWSRAPSVVPPKPYLPPLQRPLNYPNKVAPLPIYEPYTPKPVLPAPSYNHQPAYFGQGNGRVVAVAPHVHQGDKNVKY